MFALVSIAGMANMEERSHWAILTNQLFWLLSTTYLSAFGTLLALGYSGLHTPAASGMAKSASSCSSFGSEVSLSNLSSKSLLCRTSLRKVTSWLSSSSRSAYLAEMSLYT